MLSAIIHRVRDQAGAVPLIPAYDSGERLWSPPAPLLFQRRVGSERRAINANGIREMLTAALACTSLTDPATGRPLHFTPHDFRRLFITDAILNGLPPHIAQILAGHRDISVTMGYKAVYPDEAIQAHLAFLASHRRRMAGIPRPLRAAQGLHRNMRTRLRHPMPARAQLRLRCSLHWPDPAQRPRITEIRDNLIARIAEAEREGWLGEVEGLQVSLAGAEDKLAQINRRCRHRRPRYPGPQQPLLTSSQPPS